MDKIKKYRKKPLVIDATQWFKNGDHPNDGTETFEEGEFKGELLEGKVVRYYRAPDIDGDKPCSLCKKTMHVHGWIDTLEGGHIVCPEDYIITGIKGEYYPCKPDIFNDTYEDNSVLIQMDAKLKIDGQEVTISYEEAKRIIQSASYDSKDGMRLKNTMRRLLTNMGFECPEGDL